MSKGDKSNVTRAPHFVSSSWRRSSQYLVSCGGLISLLEGQPVRREHHRPAVLYDAHDGIPEEAAGVRVHPRGGFVLNKHRRSSHGSRWTQTKALISVSIWQRSQIYASLNPTERSASQRVKRSRPGLTEPIWLPIWIHTLFQWWIPA